MAQKSSTAQSLKRIGIDKTNTNIVIVTSVATFVVIFSLVASFSLLSKLNYQNRVIGAKKAAVTQLKKNLTARDSLVGSYKAFAASSTNIIGGSVDGSGAQDGSNAKLVLDALPSKYDYPALATSLEKIGSEQQVTIESISGTDDEVAQSALAGSGNPTPVEMPFTMKIRGDYAAVQRFTSALERSIRPIAIDQMQISGDKTQLSLSVTAKTYYQPEKTLTIGSKVIK